MSLGLSITIKPRDLAKIAKQEERDVKRGIDKAIGRVGSLGKQIILKRTKVGEGVDGPFKPYTAAYMSRLAIEGKPDSPVDLFNTGQMLRSMQVRQRDSRTTEIYFDNPEAAKKAAFNDRTRPFFGFNQKEKDRLVALFRREIDK